MLIFFNFTVVSSVSDPLKGSDEMDSPDRPPRRDPVRVVAALGESRDDGELETAGPSLPINPFI